MTALISRQSTYAASTKHGPNGNLTYDLSNRVTNLAHNGWTEDYLYSPDNRRIWRSAGQTFCGASIDNDQGLPWDPGTGAQSQYILYSPAGQKLGVYCLNFSGSGQTHVWTASEENVYWGSRLVAKRIGVGAMGHFVTDRLHSKGDGSAFYPYGESKTGAAGDDREQFATYTRDQTSGLDYADQRWYSSRLGRFTSVDPFGEFGPQSADAKSPTTWAKFSYANADSVNGIDRNGTWPSFLDVLVGHLFAPPASVTVTAIAPKKVPAIFLIAGALNGLAYDTPELIAPIGYSPDADYHSCMEESFRHVEAHKPQFDQEAAQRSYLDWEDAEGAVITSIATAAANALVHGGTLTPVTLQVSPLIGSLSGGPVGAASAIGLMAVVQASAYIISNHIVGEPALKYLYNALVYTPSLHEVSSQCSAIWSSSLITQ